MRAKWPNRIFIFFCCASSIVARSQPVLCPPNLDFEQGNFSLWECKTGHVYATNGQNEIDWEATGQVADRHQLIPSTDNSLDFYGGFPRKCPNGSHFSVKLGNDISTYEAEGMVYSIGIPSTAANFTLIYNYAIVLQDPNHTPAEQPRFRARVTDGSGNEIS